VVPAVEPAVPTALPPVESLTPESDFLPFMREEVDEVLKRRALRTLFRDPRFNVMDGLDVYIDDFSKPDPLPEGWLEKLNQVTRLGDYRPPEEAPAEPVDAAAEPAPLPPPEGPNLPEEGDPGRALKPAPRGKSLSTGIGGLAAGPMV
jgi:hypothetical protein